MHSFKMRLPCHIKVAATAAAIIFLLPVNAQQAQPGATAQTIVDTTATALVSNRTNTTTPAPPDSIVTFEQLDMPIEMEIELSKLSPVGIKLFHDEFQGMHNGLYGEAIRTLKIWYIDDRIIGYVIEKPFDAGPNANSTIKKKINIPVTWCCTPAIEGHTEHCANTIDILRATQTANKCTGWHLKLPPPIQFQAPVKLQKRSKKDIQNEKDSTAAAFGHQEKTSDKPAKKKKGKKGQGFDQSSLDTPAASDSTGTKPVRDSIPQ